VQVKRKPGRPSKVKLYPSNFPIGTEVDLIGQGAKIPPFEPTLPPSASAFPPAECGIQDSVRVLRLAYLQMTIEKLRAQQTSYRLSFDNQIKELTSRKTTTLAQLQQELSTADGMYLAIQKEIETAHGISLAGYTFNPETGTLHKILDPSKKADDAGVTAAPTQTAVPTQVKPSG
jgi:hypothetical protein